MSLPNSVHVCTPDQSKARVQVMTYSPRRGSTFVMSARGHFMMSGKCSGCGEAMGWDVDRIEIAGGEVIMAKDIFDRRPRPGPGEYDADGGSDHGNV